MNCAKTILILDTETTSLDPATGRLIEVAAAVYSVEHRSLVRARSWLIEGATNEAEAVNGIAPALLSHGIEEAAVMRQIHAIATKECEVIVAHNASFDRQWFEPSIQNLAWACSCDDMEWPRKSTSRSLAALALAHGVGVVSAHRALDDVMTLVRMFERAAELGADVPAMIARALRPKAKYQALVSYDDREKAKAAGFRWDGATKTWTRTLAREDVAALPFQVREVPE